MYYRIAEITLRSQLRLPSFDAFACGACSPDVTLELTPGPAPQGEETVSGKTAYRKTAEGWFYHHPSDPGAGLAVSGDYSRIRLIRPDQRPVTFREEHYIKTALECLLARRGYISLHAACIALDGEAIAFTGNAGAGKSTRAAAWRGAFQASLVSGDRPLIRAGGPEAFGVPWDGKECCYQNVHYPLRSVFEVRRSDTVRIRALSYRQKQRLLLRQCFIPMWDTDTAAVQMTNISRFASRAMIARAFCGPGAEDAKALRKALETNSLLEEEPDMRAKKGFIMRNIADDYMIIPVDDNINTFNGTLLLNEVSAFIWEKLQNSVSRGDLLAAVLDEYDADEAEAAADLDAFLARLREFGVIEDD